MHITHSFCSLCTQILFENSSVKFDIRSLEQMQECKRRQLSCILLITWMTERGKPWVYINFIFCNSQILDLLYVII